ncbi:EAL domain-containing protein [uncultured Pseudoteredinibacter sp.]|uniref:EAL domain-containing protein n=1 Tax=uncultured Pseudoteredinibacter sp. TaxID=1641701 RepID=UPI002632539F|nr:EAL domain-containing protein [uncultured Pseudoteredinibacter sp.]
MIKKSVEKIIKEPIYRISFGLALLSLVLFFVADSLGIKPHTSVDLNKAQRSFERLAVHEIAQTIISGDSNLANAIAKTEESVAVSYAILLDPSGDVLEVYGDYKNTTDSATYNVPLVLASWIGDGELKIGFEQASESSRFDQALMFIGFIVLSGFFIYILFLRRVMEGINPESVIPERVKIALDTLSEGLMIVDTDNKIVFANESFCKTVHLPMEKLLAKQSQQLAWEVDEANREVGLPWLKTLANGESVRSVMLSFVGKSGLKTPLSTNASAILGVNGELMGALVTIDDISKVEKTNQELTRLISELDKSQREINRQNKELKYLATRDSLTGVLNRRSLMQNLDASMISAYDSHEPICCLMIDIDHFKRVNDNYGHLEGDNVIKLLANTLVKHSRPNDLVGRYGGEEFLLILPGSNEEAGFATAERIRAAIETSHHSQRDNHIPVTASFGISCCFTGSEDVRIDAAEFIDRADMALYKAKQTGRNKAICWSKDLEHSSRSESSNIKKEAIKSKPRLEYKVASSGTTEVAKKSLVGSSLGRTVETTVFLDRISQALKSSKRGEDTNAIVVFNCDEIQYVYETMGISHAENLSDKLLSRISKMLRETDTVAISDDERGNFSVSQISTNDVVVLLPGVAAETDISNIMHRIFVDLKRPEHVNSHDVFLDCYAGISIAGVDGDNPEDLIRFASQAMLEAKRSKLKQRFLFFCQEIDANCRRQFTLESDLYKAIEQEQFFLHYQPKVIVGSGQVYGLEALIRWKHPDLGIVSPAEFIGLSERIGLIGSITEWVIRKAAEDFHHWQSLGLSVDKIAVNLSASEFHDQKLATNLITLLDEVKIPKNNIEFEITETVLISNKYAAVCLMETLSEAGIQITLDDFGVEYSSLAYIKHFPIESIKIDRSFISELNTDRCNAAIVKSMISLAKSLGLCVIAEGVETEEQLAFLHALACDKAQGFFLEKPISAEQVIKLLKNKTLYDSNKLYYESEDIIRPYVGDSVEPLSGII